MADVVAFLHEVRRAHPDTPEVHEVLSRAYTAGGEEQNAAASLRTAASLRKRRAGSLADRLAIARMLITAGYPDEAEAELRAALELSPDDLDALSLLGRIKHVRGELSIAIACWERIRGQSPHNEGALLTVGVLHHLAQDPRRAPDDLSILEQRPANRRHLVHREIERALRLFVDGRLAECLRLLDRVAARECPRDADLGKTAILARAWVQEATGDVAGACATLEALGSQAGFSADLDRLLFLVRLYERSDDPTLLSRAIQVLRYLEGRFEKISVLSRLARLYERTGDDHRAREYGRRYQQSFLRRMGAPTLAELLSAALLWPLPVESFCRFTFSEQERSVRQAGSTEPRERALLHLLGRDEDKGREAFEEICSGAWATACDWAYLGELRRRAADGNGAIAALLESIEREPDPALKAMLLGRVTPLVDVATDQGTMAMQRLATMFTDPALRREVCDALRDGARQSPMQPRPFHALSLFERATGMEDVAVRHTLRAQALAAHQGLCRIGHVQAAAAYYLFGRAKGLVHEVWAGRYPVASKCGRLEQEDLLGNIAPDLRALLTNLFDATRVYVQRKFPHRCVELDGYRYTFKITKEDEPSSGPSLGLPAAVAIASVLLQLPVPQDVALSGAIVSDAGHVLAVRRIGDAEHKVAGAVHKGLRGIVLPAENRIDVERGILIPPPIASRFVTYVATLDEALEALFGPSIWDV